MTRSGKIVLFAMVAAALSACAQLKPERKAAPVVAAAAPAATPTPAMAPPPPSRPVTPASRTCVPRTLAPPPRYPDTDSALREAAGAADRYQLLAAGRLLRQKRLDELERVVAGCRQAD